MTRTCAGCGHENREGRRFCSECGRPLVPLVCPSCGAANEAGEKFCGDCGASLTATEASGPSSPATGTVAGEKKHITVLFADVAGSMDLQERLDAEVWAQIMGRFVAILAEGVRKFGGTVDKFTGDTTKIRGCSGGGPRGLGAVRGAGGPLPLPPSGRCSVSRTSRTCGGPWRTKRPTSCAVASSGCQPRPYSIRALVHPRRFGQSVSIPGTRPDFRTCAMSSTIKHFARGRPSGSAILCVRERDEECSRQ
jgi:hypothetical protein